MYRRELTRILLKNPMSLHELATALDEPVKDVEDDLRHLQKSLRHGPYRFEIIPATCRHCGFVFHRDRMGKPGKCPRCKESWISAPLIVVEEK